jgi:uncharacterized membrane protein YphA (DoxX/SURF4 family)
MEHLSASALRLARTAIAIVFILNATGVIDQTIPAKEVTERGVPSVIVLSFMVAGQALELVAGFALAFSFFPRLASLALVPFLIPATLVLRSFLLSAGTPADRGNKKG